MKWLLLSFLALIAFFSFGEITLAARAPQDVTVTKSGDGYLVNFNLPDYKFETVNAEGKEYLQLIVDGYGTTSEVGLPALPLISFNLQIPYSDETPEYDIKALSKSDQVISEKIYPFQMPWEKNHPLSERPFTINNDYYNSKGSPLPFVKISEPFIISGVKGVMVTIYPFSYNPAENKLTITTSGSFMVKLKSSIETPPPHSKTMNKYLKSIFVNFSSLYSPESIKYLIITDPTLESGLTPFIDHKTSNGFNIDVFNTGTAGTTNTEIKSFIQQRYDNLDTRPEFVLLVGDVNAIPAWIGAGEGNPLTDINYAMLDGTDYYADVFLGRYSVTNLTQLANAIDKTVYMEDNLSSIEKKNVFMASNDNYSISEGTHNFVIDTYFDPNNYTNLKLYCHTYGATTQQLINALNDNQLFAIYSGHGDVTLWADGPPLNESQVNALTNTIYPYVYSFACLTGQFDYGECFGETWLRTEHGGASFYGSSVTSYWDQDDILERRVFKAMFDDGLTKVTPMFNQGKAYLADYYGGFDPTVKRYFEMYNLMGDPSLETVEFGPPCPVDAASDPTPPNNATDISVSGTTLTWANGTGTTNVEVFFGPAGNVQEVYNGSVITTWPTGALDYHTIYNWRIKCNNDTCGVTGPTWNFMTEQNPFLQVVFYDDFESGCGNWTITNDGGTCVWDCSHDASEYQLGSTGASGHVMAADADYCGSGSTLLSTATLTNPIDATSTNTVYLDFDNDWYIIDADDEAYVEVSIDGGSNWTSVWQFISISQRGTHEFVDLSSYVAGYSFMLRYKTIQPGWDWWWAVDNVAITLVTPVELSSFSANANNGNVVLNWATATETNNKGFQVERKTESKQYQNIAFVDGQGTTTQLQQYSYVDKNVASGKYTYRLKQMDFDGKTNYFKEVEVEVKVPAVYSLKQNYPNPFNPSTKIDFSLAADSKVTLKVYDVLGRQAAELLNSNLSAGEHTVSYSASNLTSGVYFYRLEAHGRDGEIYNSIKKMILIK